MNALELAETLEKHWPNTPEKFNKIHKAAAMLRRQHEAIQLLRDALEMIDDTCMGGSRVEMLCRNTLKDTEDLV